MWVSALCCCVNEDVFSCGYRTVLHIVHSSFRKHEVYKLWSVVGALRGVCGVRACQRAGAAPGPPPPSRGYCFRTLVVHVDGRRLWPLPRQHHVLIHTTQHGCSQHAAASTTETSNGRARHRERTMHGASAATARWSDATDYARLCRPAAIAHALATSQRDATPQAIHWRVQPAGLCRPTSVFSRHSLASRRRESRRHEPPL